MKKITLPLLGVFGLTALTLFAFKSPISENNDDKCHIKIVKIVNGVETVVDSTFDCNENMIWTSKDGKNIEIKKDMKVMMLGDGEHINVDSLLESLDLDIDIKIDGDDQKQIKIIKKMMDENGKEIIIEDGNVKWITEDEDVTIDIDDNGTKKEVKIIKKVDDNGEVTVQKWVNGEEVEASEEDMKKDHKVMIFKSKDGEDVEMMMDVDVDVKTDGTNKHIVIISSISTQDLENEMPAVATNISKKELEVDDLKFSPNPNNGKFDLTFKTTNKKEPISVKIFDLQGKEVYNETVTKFSGNYSKNIDISENGKGTYILQILQGNKAKTNKVVIK